MTDPTDIDVPCIGASGVQPRLTRRAGTNLLTQHCRKTNLVSDYDLCVYLGHGNTHRHAFVFADVRPQVRCGALQVGAEEELG